MKVSDLHSVHFDTLHREENLYLSFSFDNKSSFVENVSSALSLWS